MYENVGALLYGIKNVKVENMATEKVGPDDILVEMKTVGICGTDIHLYLDGGVPGLGMLKDPMVIGHEGSGIVLAKGSNVERLDIGDHVVLDPNVKCLYCTQCINGRENLCVNSTMLFRGFFEKYHVHNYRFAYKLPPGIPADEAAVIEPVACTVHAIQRGKVHYGQTVLICGAGPIGLLHLLVARVYGASKIIVTDVDKERLGFAKELGADEVILIEKGSSPKEIGDQIYNSNVKYNDCPGVDVTFDCSGAPFSLQLAAFATKQGGRLGLTGLSGVQDAQIPINVFTVKEIDIYGVIRYRSTCFREAIQLVSSRQVDVRPLISHRFPLAEIGSAFEKLTSRQERVIKVLIDCAK